MGRGRTREPAALKVVKGTHRNWLDGELPPLAGTAPQKPDWLEVEASKVWDELIPQIADVAVERDVHKLAQLCQWIAQGRTLNRAMAESDPLNSAHSGIVRAADKAAANVDRFGQQFGLSPADRRKHKIALVKAAPVEPIRVRPRY